jgi:hypothetical protein
MYCPVAVGLGVDDAIIVEEGLLVKVDVVPPEEPDAEPVEEGAAELEPASTKLATRGPEGVLNGRVVDLCDDRFYVRRKIKRQNSNSSHLVL